MVAPGEPLFTEEDRAWAEALKEIEADTCPGCGEQWSESSDPANEFEYTASLVICHACGIAAKTAKAHQDNKGTTDGLHVHVKHRKHKHARG